MTPDVRESMRQSIANFSTRASSVSELPKANSVLGQIHGVHLKDPPDSVRDPAGVIPEGGDAPDGGEHPSERTGDHVVKISQAGGYVGTGIIVGKSCDFRSQSSNHSRV